MPGPVEDAAQKPPVQHFRFCCRVESRGGEDADTLAFLDNVFAGRWMSSVGETGRKDLPFTLYLEDLATPWLPSAVNLSLSYTHGFIR